MDKTDDGFDPATFAQHFNNPVPRMDLTSRIGATR
jgi:hypothetical protein